jgi:hypothetical protein
VIYAGLIVLITQHKKKPGRHFISQCVFLKKELIARKCIYTSLVRPILEYGAAWWDPFKEGQINAFDRVQKKGAKFANSMNDLNQETA